MTADAAAVRQWAKESGLDVSENGRLSSDVYLAYDLAHGLADDGVEAVPVGGQGDAPEPDVPSSDQVPPAPSPGPVYEQDPAPKRPKASKQAKGAPAKITEAVRKDIRGKVVLLAAIPAGMFAQRDPVCGEVLEEQLPEISDAVTDLICDSPDLVVFFTSGAGYMKWLRLAAACGPVASVMYQHHIVKSIGSEQRGGAASWDGFTVPADESRYHAPAL